MKYVLPHGHSQISHQVYYWQNIMDMIESRICFPFGLRVGPGRVPDISGCKYYMHLDACWAAAGPPSMHTDSTSVLACLVHWLGAVWEYVKDLGCQHQKLINLSASRSPRAGSAQASDMYTITVWDLISQSKGCFTITMNSQSRSLVFSDHDKNVELSKKVPSFQPTDSPIFCQRCHWIVSFNVWFSKFPRGGGGMPPDPLSRHSTMFGLTTHFWFQQPCKLLYFLLICVRKNP